MYTVTFDQFMLDKSIFIWPWQRQCIVF